MSRKSVLKIIYISILSFFFTFTFVSLNRFDIQAADPIPTIEWIGGTDSEWETGANWSTGVVPTVTDDVLINVAGTINLNGTTTVNSLVLGNSTTSTAVVLNFAYDAVTNGALIVGGGDIKLYAGTQITHSPGTDVVVGTVNINVSSGNLIIESEGSINVNSKGYAGRYGPGAGLASDGGAGYASYGTSGNLAGGGSSYGSIKNPLDLGSGGGEDDSSSPVGGPGGGLVVLSVSGSLTVNGSITSNGNDSLGHTSWGMGGAGSGGSINITTNAIEGSGTVTLNGGMGIAGSLSTSKGGGGSGGRIAINYNSNTFNGTLTAYGGRKFNSLTRAGAGTIYMHNIGVEDTLILDNTISTTRDSDVYTYLGSETVGIDNIVVRNKAKLIIDNARTFSSLNVQDSAIVELNYNTNLSQATSSNSGELIVVDGMTLSVGDLTLSNDGILRIPSLSTVLYTNLILDSGTIYHSGGDFAYLNGSDDLVIPAGTSVYMGVSKGFNSLTVNGNFIFNYDAVGCGDDPTLGCTPDPITTGNVTVNSGGKITHSEGTSTVVGSIFLDVTGNVDIQVGGAIDASGKGYTAQQGIGTSTGTYSGGGAGYGGEGGISQHLNAGGITYGLISDPLYLGSGGGYLGPSSAGGSGGGLVKLSITGDLIVNGDILANGLRGTSTPSNNKAGGGGSGGSININTSGIISGSGTISSSGGNGASSFWDNGGAGGGGRILIQGYSSSTYSGNINVYGGIGGAGNKGNGMDGGSGTILLKASGSNGDLIIDNNVNTDLTKAGITPINYTSALDSFNARNYAYFTLQNSLNTLSFSLSGNSYHILNYGLTTTDFTVDTSSYLSVESPLATNNFSIDGNSTVYLKDTVGVTSQLSVNSSFMYVNSTASVTYGSFSYLNAQLGDGGGVFEHFTLSPLVIDAGSTIIGDTPRTYTSGEINGTLTHSSNVDTKQYWIEYTFINDLTISATGSINVDGKGYAGGYGTGVGQTGESNNAAGGGGHGGAGGDGNGDRSFNNPKLGGIANDETANPIDLGSGGGGGGTTISYGGSGGGLVKLNIGGNLNVLGSISAKGVVGMNDSIYRAGGGGAGGTINVSCVSFLGNGNISLKGGPGITTMYSASGGGGGGIIAVNANYYLFDGTIDLSGGASGLRNSQPGEVGRHYPYEVAISTNVDVIDPTTANVYSDITSISLYGISSYGHIIKKDRSYLAGILPQVYVQYGLDDNGASSLVTDDQSGLINGTLKSGTSERNTNLASSESIVGRGFSFDGVDDHIQLSTGFADFTNGMTISLWANPTSSKNMARFVDIGQGSNNDNIILYRSGTTNDLAFNVRRGTSWQQLAAPGVIENNVWQHFVVSQDNLGNVVIYKNGVSVATGTVHLPVNEPRNLNYIGRSNWSTDAYFEGYMDEIVIFSGPIDQTGVDYLYNSGFGRDIKVVVGIYGYNTLDTPGAYSTSLTQIEHSTDFTIEAYLENRSGSTTYLDPVSFSTPSPNDTPVVSATDISISHYNNLYAGKSYSIDTIYSDPDGSSDLDKLYLKIENTDGVDIELRTDNSLTELLDQTPEILSGSSYISNVTYSIYPTFGTDQEVKVVWEFDMGWDWTKSDSIKYGIRAIDVSLADTGYVLTTNTYSYKNTLEFNQLGTLLVTDELANPIPNESWMLPNSVVNWTGYTVVYEGETEIYPNPTDYNVRLEDGQARFWLDGGAEGIQFDLSTNTLGETTIENIYTLSIVDITTGGSSTDTKTFTIKVDGDNPVITFLDSTTHSDEEIWYSENIFTAIWEVLDIHSGVETVYRYLIQDGTVTDEDIILNGVIGPLSEWTSDELADGVWNFYLLVRDTVGNVVSSMISFSIDTFKPNIGTISGEYNNVWQNVTRQPILSWNNPNSISGNIYYITTDGTTPSSSNFRYATNQTTYTVPAQSEGETTIKVLSKSGSGIYGDVSQYILKYDITPPSEVSDMSATVDATNRVTLNWLNPTESDFTKTVVVRKTDAIPSTPTDGTKIYEGTIQTFTGTSLESSTTYYYAFWSYDHVGNMSQRSSVSITTRDLIPPGVVTQFVATNVDEGLRLTWRNPSDADFSKVILSRNNQRIYEGRAQTFNDSNIQEEGTYRYSITAYDYAGNTSRTVTIDFVYAIPKTEPIPTESNSSISVKTNEKVEIKVPVNKLQLSEEDTDIVERVVMVINEVEYDMTLSEDRKYYVTVVDTPSVSGQYVANTKVIKNGEVFSVHDIDVTVESVEEDTLVSRNIWYIVGGILLLGGITGGFVILKRKK